MMDDTHMELGSLFSSSLGAEVRGDVGRPVSGLSYDSRLTRPGDVFFALRGAADGHIFAADAVAAGAVAVCAERPLDLPDEVVQVIVPDSRRALADAASLLFRRPSAEFALAGITGTNGKTTTCFMLESIIRAAGLKAGLIGTVLIRIGEEEMPVTHTTPESLELQQLFRRMADCGVQAVAMEVSSHALDQGRVRNSEFKVVGFTNLTQDHLDYHEDMEQYFTAKSGLFQAGPDGGAGRRAVINCEDPYGERLAAETDLPVMTVGKVRGDLTAKVRSMDAAGSRFDFRGGELDGLEVALRMPGDFNVMNALVAAGCALGLGIGAESIVAGLEGLRAVPGRFERVDEGLPFAVVVDYAHTPDSLEKTLIAARVLTRGRVISVFGCGGDRDRAKRPLMGGISGQRADKTILTSDNPRSEEPESILDEIETGIAGIGADYVRIADRREAIRMGIGMAAPGDIVVIAGKGHETGQKVGDRVIPFDDREVARSILEERGLAG